jgi:MoaA/NifB/PqqE/SkfB family radical SAM enzyme
MMVVSPLEIARRAASVATGHLRTLPVLALSVHSACNCRCVMCDIWKANTDKRELSDEALDRHLASIRRLHVRRVMLTGGEPLLHSNLWRLCERLRGLDIRLTLVTTGLLLEAHEARVAELIDEVVISVDGAADVHDAIRRVPGAFARIVRGVAALRRRKTHPRSIARSVVQQRNYRSLDDTIRAVHEMGVDRLSFLAADVTSTAFNRPEPWSVERQQEVALSEHDVPQFATVIARAESTCRAVLDAGFVQDGTRALWRIHDHYAAAVNAAARPRVRCNAPWVSAVLEPDGSVRPCFFHPPYPGAGGDTLESMLNSPRAVAFRRNLNVDDNVTCQRCVCSLSLPLASAV